MTDKPTPPLSGEEAMPAVAMHADVALQDAQYEDADESGSFWTYDAAKFIASMRGNGYEIRRIDPALSAPPQDGDRSAKSSSSPAVAAPRPPVAEFSAASDIVDRLREMEADKDAAYLERNRLVALLAAIYPSGIARTDIPGWLPEWHGCVYIDLPTGQASWHYHDSHAPMFAHLPPYYKPWDGHTTDQKYERVAALKRPTFDEVVVWFNAWLKEPVNARDRVLIAETLGHVHNHTADIWRVNKEAADREQEGSSEGLRGAEGGATPNSPALSSSGQGGKT